MEASEEKRKIHESKKHIGFKDVDKSDNPKKGQGPSRSKGSKLGPKYERELKKFREETLQKVKIFRNARLDWVRLLGDQGDGQKIDSNIYYGLQIDKSRTIIMKKLGFKTYMVRPHRKTLRPRIYFTMKKNIPPFGSIYDGRSYGSYGSEESPIIREFRKKAKKAAVKMTKKKELEDKKLTSAEKSRKKEKVSEPAKQDKVESDELQLSNVPEEKIHHGDSEVQKTEQEDSEDKELSTKEVGELISKESKAQFDKILKDLKANFGFEDNTLTDEDRDVMKQLWKEYRTGAIQTTEKKLQSHGKEESGPLKFFQKLIPEKGKWWGKIGQRMGYKRKLAKGAKPCTCQILEGDGIVIVKNVCECSLQCKRRTIIEGTEKQETPSLTDAKVVTVSPKLAASSSIASKIVDSLEILRRRVTSRGSQICKTNVKEEEEKTLVTGSPPTKLKGNEEKNIHVPNQKFDSASPALEKPLGNKPNEENKASTQGKKQEQKQENDSETLDEEEKALTDLKKFKRKKLPQPSREDIVPPIVMDEKPGALKDKKATASEDKKGQALERQQKSVEELTGVKEIVGQKETTPRKTLSTASGKSKTDGAGKTSKTLDDSGAVKTKSQEPKPILGKTKRQKTKVNDEHVTFDVQADQSRSSSFLKYGEKKMKTVMSVVNIIKKK